MIKRILLGLVLALAMVFLFWASGFNFERGEWAFWCTLVSGTSFVAGLILLKSANDKTDT